MKLKQLQEAVVITPEHEAIFADWLTHVSVTNKDDPPTLVADGGEILIKGVGGITSPWGTNYDANQIGFNSFKSGRPASLPFKLLPYRSKIDVNVGFKYDDDFTKNLPKEVYNLTFMEQKIDNFDVTCTDLSITSCSGMSNNKIRVVSDMAPFTRVYAVTCYDGFCKDFSKNVYLIGSQPALQAVTVATNRTVLLPNLSEYTGIFNLICDQKALDHYDEKSKQQYKKLCLELLSAARDPKVKVVIESNGKTPKAAHREFITEFTALCKSAPHISANDAEYELEGILHLWSSEW